jgi:dihydrofolate synthase/folylpolyglutamate synthase
MDHMAWLGDTLSLIAAEKAGIIKQGIPVVSAPQLAEAVSVLEAKANETASNIGFIDRPCNLPLALQGAHQRWNAALALAAIEASGMECSAEAAAKGLSSVRWPARFQRVRERIVVDGAHNEHSISALVSTWLEVFGKGKASIVFGALRDKEYGTMIKLLAPIAKCFLFVPVQSDRSEDPLALASCCESPCDALPNLASALQLSLAEPHPVLITGSLFLAGEALDALEKA